MNALNLEIRLKNSTPFRITSIWITNKTQKFHKNLFCKIKKEVTYRISIRRIIIQHLMH